MCRATVGATPVNRWTVAASAIFSYGSRGTPSCGKTLNRVPELPKAHDAVSIRCVRSTADARARVCGDSSDIVGLLWSEVELVDVAGVERERVAEHHCRVCSNGVLAELAGGELLTLLAGDQAGGERGARVGGQVAEVGRVPQRERLHRAVLDELLHLVRGAQTGQLDLALVRRAGQVPGGRGHPDRGRRDDALEVGVLGQQALRLLEGLLVVVVAVHGV